MSIINRISDLLWKTKSNPKQPTLNKDDRETEKNYNTRRGLSQEEIARLIASLQDAIKWTEFLTIDFDFEAENYGTVFRQTNPDINGTKLYSFDHNDVRWNVDDYSSENYKIALQFLVGKRSKWIEQNETLKVSPNGRILVFQTQLTTQDGAPITESEGFVDEGDIPPIDTWLFLKEGFYGHGYGYSDLALFCWIPQEFESKMQAAIDVEIFDSYDWLDELNPKLNSQILKSL